MALIVHPNVVRVYSTGLENGIYYVAMEVVNGGTMAKAMEHQTFSELAVVRLAIQVAEGLQAAHHVGLLHRDVKPGNILFADSTTVKVADFGLALTVQQAAAYDGDVWGTPEYVAPEKILKQGEDVRSDIYSLGATLYHMLTGRRVFDGSTPSEIALKHVENRPVPVQTYAPHVSDEFTAIIAQTLEKAPDLRQQSYDELLDQLRYLETKLSEGLTGRKQMKAALEKQNATEQRHSALLVVVALLVVAMIVGGVLIFRGTKPDTASIEKGEMSAARAALVAQPSEFRSGLAALAKNDVNAPTLFRKVIKSASASPTDRAWAQFLEGASWIALGKTEDAKTAFAAVRSHAEKLENHALGSFLTRISARMNAPDLITPDDGKGIEASTHEAAGLLVYGLQSWWQGQPEIGVQFLRQFRSATPKGDVAWLEEIKPLASEFVDRLARFEVMAVTIKQIKPPGKRKAMGEEMRTIDPILSPRVEKILAAAMEAAPPPPPVAVDNTASKDFMSVVNQSDGRVMDVHAYSKELDGRILLHPERGKSNQIWRCVRLENQTCRFVVKHSGMALAVPANEPAPGTPLEQMPVADDPRQIWKMEPANDGWFIMRHPATGLLAAAPKGRVELRALANSPNAYWMLKPPKLE